MHHAIKFRHMKVRRRSNARVASMRMMLLICFPLLLVSIVLSVVVVFTTSVPTSSTTFPMGGKHEEPPIEDFIKSLAYIPTLLASDPTTSDTIPKTRVTIHHWKEGGWPPVIHIIKTRFMQEQGHLVALGKARLALFQTFCLPTIAHQTSRHFLWIIKYDPDLDRSILYELIQSLENMNNVYLVPSNRNFRINQQFPGGWRDAAEIADLDTILSGNRTRLQYAMELQAELPVLETRLDADDGLNLDFVSSVQEMALETFVEEGVRWMYWCSRRHLEWFWGMDSSYGSLEGIAHERICVTPGITTGFAVGTSERDVPIFAHHELVRSLEHETSCGSTKCLRFIDRFIFDAVRSRCPTSAGMANVLEKYRFDEKGDESHGKEWVQYAFWNMLHESFYISRPTVSWVNDYVGKHIVDIARDNLKGQCTSGAKKRTILEYLTTLQVTLVKIPRRKTWRF